MSNADGVFFLDKGVSNAGRDFPKYSITRRVKAKGKFEILLNLKERREESKAVGDSEKLESTM